MNLSVETVTVALAALLGTSAVGTGAGKAVKMFRQIAMMAFAILGDGTPEHPGMVNRLGNLEKLVRSLQATLDKHVDADAPTWLADGQAWGHRLDGQVESLDQRVSALEGTDSFTRSRPHPK
jgi:hypothetical protein